MKDVLTRQLKTGACSQHLSIGSKVGNSSMLSLCSPGIVQRTVWQFNARENRWIQINATMEGARYYPPNHAADGTLFDDLTNKIIPPPIYSVVGAGSGRNEARILSSRPKEAKRTVVTDIQSEPELAQYEGYEETQTTLARLGTSFFSGVDSTVSPVRAPHMFMPFMDTGTRNPRSSRPLTSQVVHDSFVRTSEEQQEGDTITASIYQGSQGQYPFGQRYKLSAASTDAGYELRSAKTFGVVPTHERTDHKGGVSLKPENIIKYVFEKSSHPEPFPKRPPDPDDTPDTFL